MRLLRFCVVGQKLSRNPESDFTGLIRGSKGFLKCSFRPLRGMEGLQSSSIILALRQRN